MILTLCLSRWDFSSYKYHKALNPDASECTCRVLCFTSLWLARAGSGDKIPASHRTTNIPVWFSSKRVLTASGAAHCHGGTDDLHAKPAEDPLFAPHPSLGEAALLCALTPLRLPLVGFLGHGELLHFIGAICIHCPSVPVQQRSLATCASIKLLYLSCKTGRKMFA